MSVHYVTALLVLLVATLVILNLPRPSSIPPRSQPPRTDFVLGRWYCCLLDDHPYPIPGNPIFLGGFGGRNGRPVLE